VFKLGEWLGNTLGQIAADMEDEAYIGMNHEIIRLATGQLPMALRPTQAEMTRYRLTETEPY